MQRFVFLLICAICFHIIPVNAQDDQPIETSETQQTLKVWIPANLISDLGSDAYQQLLEHTNQFAFENNVDINYRIKAIGEMGGIMSTIRSGSVVAPGALPDVTLIRRVDLVTAQATSFLQSLEGLFSSVLIDDLNNSLKLGQVTHDGEIELFGLPYFVDFQITVANHDLTEITNYITFDDILQDNHTYFFPAGRSSGLNQTFYIQYLASGGVALRTNEININRNALQTVLSFYESAIEQDIINPQVLEYNSPSAYRTEFLNMGGQDSFGIFSYSDYLLLSQQDSSLNPVTIPTENGDSITTLNGWVWVMVTPDPRQQNLSVQYLNWMMLPEFHARFSSALNQLPAQEPAISASLPDSINLEFVEVLLSHAVLPLPESEGGTIPRAMQDALIRVISGEATAEEATQAVLAQFGLD